MPVLAFPTIRRPSEAAEKLIGLTQTHESPFDGTMQTLEMPGARSRSSSVAPFTARLVPKCISSAFLRAGPMPGTSSSGLCVMDLARFARCAPIANLCASSRRRCRKNITGAFGGSVNSRPDGR